LAGVGAFAQFHIGERMVIQPGLMYDLNGSSTDGFS